MIICLTCKDDTYAIDLLHSNYASFKDLFQSNAGGFIFLGDENVLVLECAKIVLQFHKFEGDVDGDVLSKR